MQAAVCSRLRCRKKTLKIDLKNSGPRLVRLITSDVNMYMNRKSHNLLPHFREAKDYDFMEHTLNGKIFNFSSPGAMLRTFFP